jgi:hypothetical protein
MKNKKCRTYVTAATKVNINIRNKLDECYHRFVLPIILVHNRVYMTRLAGLYTVVKIAQSRGKYAQERGWTATT